MNFWRLQGWLYDTLFALVPHRQLVQQTASSVQTVPGTVVDAGCGSGRLAMYANRPVLGIDFSDTVLRVARKRCSSLVQADLCDDWPLASGSTGCVVSLNVLYALPDSKKYLEEASRVLESGGRLILATPTSDKLFPLIKEHFAQANAKELAWSLINLPRFIAWGINLTFRGMFEDSKFSFYSTEELIKLVENTDLRVIDVSTCYAGIDAMVVAEKE